MSTQQRSIGLNVRWMYLYTQKNKLQTISFKKVMHNDVYKVQYNIFRTNMFLLSKSNLKSKHIVYTQSCSCKIISQFSTKMANNSTSLFIIEGRIKKTALSSYNVFSCRDAMLHHD